MLYPPGLLFLPIGSLPLAPSAVTPIGAGYSCQVRRVTLLSLFHPPSRSWTGACPSYTKVYSLPSLSLLYHVLHSPHRVSLIHATLLSCRVPSQSPSLRAPSTTSAANRAGLWAGLVLCLDDSAAFLRVRRAPGAVASVQKGTVGCMQLLSSRRPVAMPMVCLRALSALGLPVSQCL